MKDLNYAKGIERLYNVVWICLAFFGLVIYLDHPDSESFFVALLLSAVPYGVKKISIWIIQGFTEK